MGYSITDSSDYSDTNEPIIRKSYKCTITGCKATFSKNNKLTYHIRKHTGERPFVCDYKGCNKSYTNSSHLRRHKGVSHEKKTDLSVICEIDGCGRILSNRYNLKKHIRRKHANQECPFTCSECPQRFHKKKQLQQHIFSHTGETPFKCKHCNLGYVTSYDLSRHQRMHKSYNCECGEQFMKWSALLRHKKINCKQCKERSYHCNICEKTFKQQINLKSHMITHTDKMKRTVNRCPFTNCDRFYFYKRNLTYHINRFHKKSQTNLKLKCTVANCNRILSTKLTLRNHLKWHEMKNIKPEKQRQTRSDKGKSKLCMASVLTGVKLPREIHEKIITETHAKVAISNKKQSGFLNLFDNSLQNIDQLLFATKNIN